MSAGLSLQDFETRVGELFEVDIGAAAVPLRLSEVKALGSGLREGGAFSASFAGPAEPALAQATYLMRNEGLGGVELFIVPVARNRDGTLVYEAVFT